MSKQAKDFITKLEFLGYLSSDETYYIDDMHKSVGIIPNKRIEIVFYSLDRFNKFIEYTETNNLTNSYQCREGKATNTKVTFLPNSFVEVKVSIEGE